MGTGVLSDVIEHVDEDNLYGRVNGLTVCNFKWPPELPFGPEGTSRKLYTLGLSAGCPVDCGYCAIKSMAGRWRPKELKDRPWGEPTFLPTVLEAFYHEIEDPKWRDRWVLLSNNCDPFGHTLVRKAFPYVLNALLEAGARPVVLAKGVLAEETHRYFERHTTLKRTLQESEHGVWFGKTVTTLDSDVAPVIEPGAPAPDPRIRDVERFLAWSSVHAPGKVHGWYSIVWHRHTSPRSVLDRVKRSASVVVLEQLHRRNLDFPWDEYVLPAAEYVTRLRPLLTWALPKFPLVVKDELREAVIVDSEMSAAYRARWGNDVFADVCGTVQATMDSFCGGK